MGWLNWFRRKRPVFVAAPPHVVTAEEAERAEKEKLRLEEIAAKQKAIQRELGFHPWDSDQSWLRLHEILLDYEKRLRALEGKE